jgi:prevent-host-death family protein
MVLGPLARATSSSELNTDLVRPENRSYYEVMTTIPLTDAKARLNELVEETALTHERVTITRHGRPAAVLISVDDLEAMEETLFWQAQPGAHDDVQAGRAAGPDELFDEVEVRRRYGVGQAR